MQDMFRSLLQKYTTFSPVRAFLIVETARTLPPENQAGRHILIRASLAEALPGPHQKAVMSL